MFKNWTQISKLLQSTFLVYLITRYSVSFLVKRIPGAMTRYVLNNLTMNDNRVDYRGLMRGLCGNLDNNGPNDWVKPDGTAVRRGDFNAFGESWLEEDHTDSAK